MKKLILFIYYGEQVLSYKLPSNDGNNRLPLPVKLSATALDGQWFLSPHKSITLTKKQLVPGEKISVNMPNKEEALIYVEHDENQLILDKYSVPSQGQISIGNSENNNIVYDDYDMKPNHALLTMENGRGTIAAKKKKMLYVNGMKGNSVPLSFGDEILIMGQRLLFLGDALAIYPSCHYKGTSLEPYIPKQVEEELMEDGEDVEASEDGFFQRSPRIIKKLEVGEMDMDSPPPPPEQKEQPLILTIGPALTMGMAMMMSMLFTIYSSRNNPFMMIPGIAMTGAMLTGSILWPILSRSHRKKSKKKKEKTRIKRYRRYMQIQYSKLEDKIAYNKKVLLGTYPEPAVLMSRASNRDRRLWERMPSNRDFLDIRLGIGTVVPAITIREPKDSFTMVDDRLMEELKEVSANFNGIEQMPIYFSLMNNNMLGMIGERGITVETAMSTIVHLTALHSYDELKIVCVYNEKEADKWSWVKQLPHVWAPEKGMRFVASSRDEVRDVFLYLKEVLADREETLADSSTSEGMFLPHFIVYIADPSLVEDELVLRYLTDANRRLGVSTIYIYDKINLLPKECKAFIQCYEAESSLYNRDQPEMGLITFTPDTVRKSDLDGYARSLAGIKIKEIASNASLTSMLTFLEMYKVGRIEDLGIQNRWATNLSYRTLEAPLGVKAGGTPFQLNIHEKYHGPHGLVAGMTGSGKSEFIQSYILSMAVNYHPHDVSFILIDYKGGGMANCFIGLPHISGSITNLGGNQIRRSLVSLQSELKRRQRIFAEYGVNHIDKYQQLHKEGKAPEPLPHLVMISDEFAELKSQQPEFMDELVSAARIGRSLGVHLILATQKPSGVVDDQIWSNTRFRICLKILDKSDSNEMLKRPEAANIKEPGRCYVQVGNNEIFELVQSGWSGGSYVPTDVIENEEDNIITLIDGCGRSISNLSCKEKGVKSDITQLEAVVGYIADIAKDEAIEPLKLWLDPLAEEVFLDEIDQRATGFDGSGWQEVDHWLCPAIGLVDDPKNQQQMPLYMDIGNEGHMLLIGAPGTGKTTYIQTLVYALVSAYSPELVSLYFLDFGGRTMGYYKDLPHTGGIIFSEEEDKLEKLFKMLTKELANRKRKFSEYGVGTLKAYMDMTKEKVPAMIMILDNYEAFLELYDDYETIIATLSREGGNYGIFMVLTASSAGAVKFKISQNIRLTATLQLNDKYDYISIIGQTDGLEPEQVKGRGLCKMETALEFQTALACHVINEGERVQHLRGVFQEMGNAWQGARAKQIPFVPEELGIDALLDHEDSGVLLEDELVPVGYDIAEAEIVGLNLFATSAYPIVGDEQTGKTNLLRQLLCTVSKEFDWNLYVIEESGGLLQRDATKHQVDGYMSTAEEVDSFLENLLEEMKIRHKDLKAYRSQDEPEVSEEEYMRKYPRILILVDNYHGLFQMMSDKAANILENIIRNGQHLQVCFVFTANQGTLTPHAGTPLYTGIFKGTHGILLGGRMDSQNIFDVQMDYKKRGQALDAGYGYLINRHDYVNLRTPLM